MSRKWLIYFVCAPLIVVTWPVMFIMWLLWGQKLFFDVGPWFEFKPQSWPARTWYRLKVDGEYIPLPGEAWAVYGKWFTWGATALGLGGFIGPGRTSEHLMTHELVHVDQYIVGCIMGAVIGALLLVFCGDAFVALSAWSSVAYIYFLASFALAWIRGANTLLDIYHDSLHEESARAIADDCCSSCECDCYRDE